MAPPPLPVPAGQVQLQLLDGGSWMPFEMLFLGGGASKPYKMYDWAFYIFHPKLNRHILWDLGMAEVRLTRSDTFLVHDCGNKTCRARKYIPRMLVNSFTLTLHHAARPYLCQSNF